jgi:M6 family metalloprotease-like protein
LSIILCKFTDTSPQPNERNYFQNKLSFDIAGRTPGTGSVKNYWSDISNGAVNIQGSVNGWYTEQRTFAEASGRGGNTNQDCIDAAAAKGYTPPAVRLLS